MGEEKKFDKYKRYGAYHWRWYGKKVGYTHNVDFIKKWVKEKKVLDVGAGDGLITSVLGIQGIDNDQYAVRLAKRKGASVELGDAYKIPYKDKEFESAILIDTIEHFKYLDKALSEIHRVIDKFLYMNITFREKFMDPDHYRGWTKDGLIADLERCNFSLVEEPTFSCRRFFFKFKKTNE